MPLYTPAQDWPIASTVTSGGALLQVHNGPVYISFEQTIPLAPDDGFLMRPLDIVTIPDNTPVRWRLASGEAAQVYLGAFPQ